MNCLEFRRAAGADPQHLSPDALLHREGCPQCAQHLQQLLAMDVVIRHALQVPLPRHERAATRPGPGGPATVTGDRRRWYALAASVIGGVLVGFLLWSSGARDALARDAVAHLAHEPGAMVRSDLPVDPERVRRILQHDGVRLHADMGLISYAQSCAFRGHDVPHLVVQTASGPVTVLVLREEHVSRVVSFHEQGYAGTLEPVGRGAIAVIGGTTAQVREAAERVAAAIEWTD